MMDFNAPLSPGQILNGLFNNYKVIKILDPDEISSTPSIKPHTLSPRLKRERPLLYKGEALNGDRSVAIKASGQTGRQVLMNEWRALDKLNLYNRLPFNRPIAPAVHEKVFDLGNSSFFVFEWLDESEWMNIASLLCFTAPLVYWDNSCSVVKKMWRALAVSIKKMHKLDIFHGDLKDEHIFVKIEKDGQLNFSEIRIIDFGTSYLGRLEDWKGGSIGFSPPHYWDPSYRLGLQRSRLQGLDWYGAYAVLYYACTGETFPTSSPAFREMAGDQLRDFSRMYYQALSSELKKRWRRVDDCTFELLQDAIDWLCAQKFVL